MATIIPNTTSTVSAAITSGTSNTSAANGTTDSKTLAGNFNTFLQLLTTQLKNQNPLDPLDTNQFTQQLVQFAQVEQQLKSNDQLSTLVSLQQTAQQSQALGFVGNTVTVESQSAKLTDESAAVWSFNMTKPATTQKPDTPTIRHMPLQNSRSWNSLLSRHNITTTKIATSTTATIDCAKAKPATP